MMLNDPLLERRLGQLIIFLSTHLGSGVFAMDIEGIKLNFYWKVKIKGNWTTLVTSTNCLHLLRIHETEFEDLCVEMTQWFKLHLKREYRAKKEEEEVSRSQET